MQVPAWSPSQHAPDHWVGLVAAVVPGMAWHVLTKFTASTALPESILTVKLVW